MLQGLLIDWKVAPPYEVGSHTYGAVGFLGPKHTGLKLSLPADSQWHQRMYAWCSENQIHDLACTGNYWKMYTSPESFEFVNATRHQHRRLNELEYDATLQVVMAYIVMALV